MKKKKGFVFVETLVVTAVLTISLLASYSTFSALVIKEKERITYNDSAYLYRTYYIEKFLKNFSLYNVRDYIDSETTINGKKVKRAYSKIGCSGDLFPPEANHNLATCEALINSLNVENLYLTFKDLGYLQQCNNWEGDCAVFATLDDGMAEYIKTIGGSSKTGNEASQSGYRIIAEYKEKKDGTKCDSSGAECQTFYATISIGDIDGK